MNNSEQTAGRPPEPREISETALKEYFTGLNDVHMKEYRSDEGAKALLVYCEGMCDTTDIDRFVMPHLRDWLLPADEPGSPLRMPMSVQQSELPTDIPLKSLEEKVFTGELLLYLESPNSIKLFTFQISSPPIRSTEEANTEVSIMGPRDGFVEDLPTNVALLRKRLKSRSLHYDNFTIGEKSRTSVALLYLEDAIPPDLLKRVRDNLKRISVDVLHSANQLEEQIGKRSFSIFPQFHYTGRADFSADCLLRGRFLLFIDGVPLGLIGPANLLLILKSSEDEHFPFLMVSLGRILRYLGLLISIFLPGFWTSLAVYNQDQLPFPLLATVTLARLGTPLSGSAEMLIMLILLELFREAGVRLPKTISQTITVVGGIIIGEASIQAGILSPTIVIVASVSAVCSSTVGNQMLAGLTAVLRLGIFLLSAFLGMYGFLIGLFCVVLMLASTESFGYPYMAPFSPLNPKEIAVALLKLPLKWMKRQAPDAIEVPDPEQKR